MCAKIGRKPEEGECLVLPSVLPGFERDGTDYRPFMLDGVIYQKCNVCHEVKCFDEFPDNQNSVNKGISICDETGRDTGYVTKKRKQCNQCRTSSGKKHSAKANVVFKEHNIPNSTEETICEICKKTYKQNGNKKMVRDHCHITNTPRGYLCNECNTGLGKLGDDLEGVQNALNYLKSSQGDGWKVKWNKI